MPKIRIAPMIVALALTATAIPAAAQKMTPTGLWQSPGGNTRLRIAPCGKELCGTVAWGSERAKRDAARAGHDQLIGMEIFESFERTGPNTFQGRVFVPDMNRRFNGRLTMVDQNNIDVRGCVRGNVGCRTDRWTRYRG